MHTLLLCKLMAREKNAREKKEGGYAQSNMLQGYVNNNTKITLVSQKKVMVKHNTLIQQNAIYPLK